VFVICVSLFKSWGLIAFGKRSHCAGIFPIVGRNEARSHAKKYVLIQISLLLLLDFLHLLIDIPLFTFQGGKDLEILQFLVLL